MASSGQIRTERPFASGARFPPALDVEQLPSHLAERLHSSDRKAAWKDRVGR